MRDAQSLIETCHQRSVALLQRNLTPEGIQAASPTGRAGKRGYTAIFGRDASICAIGMALSGDRQLQRGAATGLHTLAAHQAPNGQIPKFVDVQRQEADFWYLGCIDSTLWWLIALDFLDRSRAHSHTRSHSGYDRSSAQPARRVDARPGGLKRRYAGRIELAIRWLQAQEHQRFFLLQQNEASDWADIMPRSGFVLYTNALWYFVKRVYGLEQVRQTYDSCNELFHPYSGRIAQYHRARLLNDYVLRQARRRELYLSFVNFSFFGEEGDVFGNVLAVLLGIANERATKRTLDALLQAAVDDPYPVRVVTQPIRRSSELWRAYMVRHRQNEPWQYHNGGIWPMVGGFWILALLAAGRRAEAQADLVKLARACQIRNWSFTEWLHGKTCAPRGMPGQSWNAAAFLMAEHAIATGNTVFGL